MTFKFRSRVFLYLLLLLVIFRGQPGGDLHRRWNWPIGGRIPMNRLSEGMTEVAQAMGLTLLLVPPWFWRPGGFPAG